MFLLLLLQKDMVVLGLSMERISFVIYRIVVVKCIKHKIAITLVI